MIIIIRIAFIDCSWAFPTFFVCPISILGNLMVGLVRWYVGYLSYQFITKCAVFWKLINAWINRSPHDQRVSWCGFMAEWSGQTRKRHLTCTEIDQRGNSPSTTPAKRSVTKIHRIFLVRNEPNLSELEILCRIIKHLVRYAELSCNWLL